MQRLAEPQKLAYPFPDPRLAQVSQVFGNVQLKVEKELTSEPRAPWLVSWIDSLPSAERDTARQFPAKYGNLSVFFGRTLSPIETNLIEKLEAAMTKETESRLAFALQQRGLTTVWQVTQLQRDLANTLSKELRNNENSFLSEATVDALVRRFDALASLDVFARTVQLLRWAKEANGGLLPDLPKEVKPSGIFLQPVWEKNSILLN